MLKLAWLGSPVAELDGVQIRFETRKIAALLAYLSLDPRGCSREKLAALFWPEFDQIHAMANLRRALGSLTRALPLDYFEINRESICFSAKASVELDVSKFQALIQDVRAHSHDNEHDNQNQGLKACQACLERLETASELNRGDFLDGLNLPDAPAFDEWQYLTRAELAREQAWALEQLTGILASQAAAGQCDWGKAAAAARRWISLDQLEAGPHLTLVRIYAQNGQRSLAQRQVEEFTRVYREEFGQEPDQDIQASFQNALNQGQPHWIETKRVPSQPLDSSQILLKTKLYLPRVKSSRVSRPRLLSRLNAVGSHKLTLISAPAGFGKTSLLAEWAAQTELLIGWLSLDSEDNDPNRFLHYLYAALDSAQEGIVRAARTLLESFQVVSPQTVITALLKDLEAAAEPIVLVLDDYQFINNPAIHDGLAYFLERAGPNLHLVIASRVDPPLPLARLRVEADLLEVRTDELRFTLEECTAFFSRVSELEITPADVQALAARTEGWAVGLQMAGISLQNAPDRSRFIQTFSGSHRYILEYLIQEVLDHQSPQVQRFLLCTSILERLSAPLCDTVLENDEGSMREGDGDSYSRESRLNGISASILEYLERANLFLVPLDDERTWYRYHHLFADLLRTQLQKSLGASGVAQLHIRASEWLAHNGSVLEAITHASLAQDDERVERFIEQNYMEIVSRGEQSSMRYWTSKLSKELVYRRPWLCIYEAHSRAWFGELNEADRLLEAAEKHISTRPMDPGEQALFGHHSYVKSRVTAMRGDIHRAITLCLAAREYIPANNLSLQFNTLVTLGYEYFLSGNYVEASRILNEAIQAGITTGALIYTVAASCILARLYANQGLLHKSYDTYQIAAKLIHEASSEHRDARALVDVGLANLLYEWNDLHNALDLQKQGIRQLHLWGKADDLILAYITLARIQLALRNQTEAAGAIGKASQLIQTSGVFSESRSGLEIAQVKFWLAQGDWPSVNRWTATLEKRFGSPDLFQFEDELTHIMQARVWIAQNKRDETIRLLSCLEESARSSGRQGRLIEILILKALVLHASGETGHAYGVLADSLALAVPEGYRRIYLDEGKAMQQLLAQFASTAPASPVRDYALHLK